MEEVNKMPNRIRTALVFFTLCFAIGLTSAFGQASTQGASFTEYKGMKIGVATDAVRSKLGSPKEKSDTQDLYVFSDNESAQFYYDASHVVNAIMITFTNDLKGAPAAKDVFGVDVPPNADGMVFKMERYPKAGYWISYTRTSGSDAMVNIAIQKM